jgi:hypothetical protein
MTSHRNHRPVSAILALLASGLASPAWALDVTVALPEPGTIALLLGGVGAAVLVWRNRRK